MRVRDLIVKHGTSQANQRLRTSEVYKLLNALQLDGMLATSQQADVSGSSSAVNVWPSPP